MAANIKSRAPTKGLTPECHELAVCMRTGIATFSDVDNNAIKKFVMGVRERNLLCALAERPDEVLDRDQLMQAAWPRLVVSQNTLTVNMSRLRRALRRVGLDKNIRTFPNVGYSLECSGIYLSAHDDERIVVRRVATSLASR